MVKVASVQMQPVFLDPGATVQKMEGFIQQASQEGARLAVFPECNISMYPNWVPDHFDSNGRIKRHKPPTRDTMHVTFRLPYRFPGRSPFSWGKLPQPMTYI